MRRAMVALALAAALGGSWALPAAAQNNGIVIQNNGVSQSDSAKGADNVRISRNDGASSSNMGAGENNAVIRAEKAPKERGGKERKNRSSDEVAAPAETAPAEGDYQAYGEGEALAEPAAPEPAPQEMAQPAEEVVAPIKLPNTGAGAPAPSLAASAIAALAAGLFAAASARRHLFR
ncbi:MAG: LPXTG cell wall anchor domain-containing protein [Thermomicrobiales bacterium]|nr:LPXTG cell wall anchor domain-containing protein [Thermomicrobiales bacterium]